MTKRVLLINSDLAKNRGDRAIAEGNIALIKQRFPDAQITGISQFPERDKQWYGTDFLDMDFQSLNPFELIRLCAVARRHDIVLWGGGEILKDYTNKAALWYWVIKMTCVSLANPNLYGAYQGVGPTKSSFSKKLIAFVARRCKVFIVRDDESFEKLVSWGVPSRKLRAASDPAVLPIPSEPDSELQTKLRDDFDISNDFLQNFICIGPRDWFHYKPSGILPYKYKKRILKALGKSSEQVESDEHRHYIRQLNDLTSTLTNDLGLNVLFVPMHMEESDTELCRQLAEQSANPDMVRVVDKDTLSPAELRSLVSQAQAMIGFRLHSNIIGVSAGVPSLNIYYVDKGRVFFDQIKQSRFALPIEAVLEAGFQERVVEIFQTILQDRKAIKRDINRATGQLRSRVTDTFNEVFDAQ